MANIDSFDELDGSTASLCVTSAISVNVGSLLSCSATAGQHESHNHKTTANAH
jgi:hypothetical protein